MMDRGLKELHVALWVLVVGCCFSPEKTQAFVNVVGIESKHFRITRASALTLFDKTSRGEETEVLLQQALGIDKPTAQTIIQKHPAIVRYQPESLLERIEWHKGYLDLDGKQLAHLLKEKTMKLYKSVETLEANIAGCQTVFGLDAEQVKLLMRKRPLILDYSLPLLKDKVECILEVFRVDLPTEREKMWKYLLQNPSALSYSKKTLGDRVDWFRNDANVPDAWILRHLLQQNYLLSLNIDCLKTKRLWLKNRLELDEEQLARIIRYHPSFLTLSIDNALEPVIQWLEQRFGLSDKSVVRTMVCTQPSILSYNIERNLEPKLAFLVNEVFGGDEAKALKVLGHNPRFLGFSLEKRLLPRWEQCKELGTSDLPSLNTMCMYTNDRWEACLEMWRGRKGSAVDEDELKFR